MKSTTIFLSAIVLSFLAFSCQSDFFSANNSTLNSTKSYSKVDQELWSYFAKFEEEARERGHSFDLEAMEISGVLEEIEQNGVAGSCNYGSHINSHVTIDQGFWDNSSALYREYVIFHELGHCVLFRGHDESSSANGSCLSIMRSGLGSCKDNYSASTREKLLDELFDNL